MRRHWFYILLSLAADARHGSGIMRDVLELTDGDLKLWPATLYGSLDELREQGLIHEMDGPTGKSKVRRYFRITPSGRRALAAEVRRLQVTVRTAGARLGLPRQPS